MWLCMRDVCKYSFVILPRGKPHIDYIVVPQAALELAPNRRVVTTCRGHSSSLRWDVVGCKEVHHELSGIVCLSLPPDRLHLTCHKLECSSSNTSAHRQLAQRT